SAACIPWCGDVVGEACRQELPPFVPAPEEFRGQNATRTAARVLRALLDLLILVKWRPPSTPLYLTHDHDPLQKDLMPNFQPQEEHTDFLSGEDNLLPELPWSSATCGNRRNPSPGHVEDRELIPLTLLRARN